MSPVSYMGDSKPFLVKLADVSSTGASITTKGLSNGFRVTIVGWPLATAFEIAYTIGSADFDSDATQHAVVAHRTVDVATADPGTYNVKVRPLMGGQVVAAFVEASVIASAYAAYAEDVVIQKADPALLLKSLDGSYLVRMGASITPTDDPRLVLELYDPAAQQFLKMFDARGDKTYIDIPNKDLFNKGKKLATEDFVVARIKTGNFVVPSTIISKSLTAVSGQTSDFPGGPFLVPDNSILRGVRLIITTDGYDGIFQTYSWSASYAFTGNNCLVMPRIDFTLFSGDLYRELTIEAWEPKDTEVVKTQAFLSNIQQNYPITPPQVVNIHLMMLFGY